MSLALISPGPDAWAHESCSISPGEAAAIQAYIQTLPLDPLPVVPKGLAPEEFSWDNIDIENGQFASYVGPSTQSPNYHCWLYSEVHSLQVLYASRARDFGYQEPSTLQRGIWLNPHVYYDCADQREMPGLEQYCVADYGTHDFGLDDHNPPQVCSPVTRWNHEPWSEHIGYVESCVQWPLPGVSYNDAKHSCGVCDRYRQIAPKDLPRWCDCSWIQSEHPGETLLFRTTGAHRLDLSSFRDEGWNVTDPEQMLETLAIVLIVYGPMRVSFGCPHRIPVVGTTNDLSAGQPVHWPRRIVDPNLACSGGEGHFIALIGYNKHDPDYADPADPSDPGPPSLTFQDFGRHGQKDIYKLPFLDFAAPLASGGANGFQDVIYFPAGSPTGIQPPYPIRVGDLPPDLDVVPLRCDVDQDGMDGYANGYRVDNCPEIPNPEQLIRLDRADQDDDGVGDACDNCTSEPNRSQRDLDDDGEGDACDLDMDGDNISDSFDCDPTNPKMGYDTDGDGVCEFDRLYRTYASHRELCQTFCRVWGRQYYGCGEGYEACLARCDPANGDNCADDLDSPATQECAASRQSLVTGGPPDTGCRDLFYNPAQEDTTPADGVGDRCQTGAMEVTFQPPATARWIGGLVRQCSDFTARVSFQANAASLDPAGELRRGVSAESCWCEDVVGSGQIEDWDAEQCEITCPRSARPAWNPVRDDAAFGSSATAYPHGGTDAVQNAFLATHAMGRDRQVTFRRSQAASRHDIRWYWTSTKQYPKTLPFDPLYDVDEELTSTLDQARPLKVRVSWPAGVVAQDGAIGDSEVRLSEGVGYLEPPHVCGVRELAVWWSRYRWIRGPGPFDQPWRTRAPQAFSIIETDDAKVHVATFRDTPANPSDVREVTTIPGSLETLDLENVRLGSGQVDQGLLGLGTGHVSTVFAYSLASAGTVTDPVEPGTVTHPGDDLPGDARATLWLGLAGRADNLWVSSVEAFGATGEPPVLVDAQLFFYPTAQALYLIGDERGSVAQGEPNQLHRLDLGSGTWTRLGPLTVLDGAEGYSVSLDPVRRQAWFFGGRIQGKETSRLVRLDLGSGLAKRQDLPGDQAEVARAEHGAFFEPYERRLYVYGGTRQGAVLGDALVADLTTGWSQLSPSGETSPGGRVRPMVLVQRSTGRLWVASGSDHDPAPLLEPWELDLARAEWHARPSLTTLPEPDPSLRDLVFSADAPPFLETEIEPGAPLAGELRLLEISTSEPGLGLKVYDDRGNLAAADERAGASRRVALLGQPGQRYLPRVEAEPGFATDLTLPLTYRDRPAALVEAAHVEGLSGVRALALVGHLAYLARDGGLSIYDLTDPAAPSLVGSLAVPGQVHDLARCGQHHLCAAATPAHHALTVIDLQDPIRPVVAGKLKLPGQCRSLAARGHRVFLACGPGGLAVADLLDPSAPVLVDLLDVGGVARLVLVRRQVLVTVTSGPSRVRTFLFGQGASPVEVASITPLRQVHSLYLNGSRLHVVEGSPGGWQDCLSGQGCEEGLQVEVYEVGWEVPTLLRLGDYPGSEALVPLGKSSGDLVAAPVSGGLRILRADVLP